MSSSPPKEPRPARQKLTINLSNQSATRLRTLAESREETLNDCVEAALNVFNYLVQARLDGFTLLLQNQAEGTTRELVLLDLPDPVPGAPAPSDKRTSQQILDQIVEDLVERLNSSEGREALNAAIHTPLDAKVTAR